MSMTGIKGEEYGNLDDLIDKDKHEVARVIKAVNRVRAEEDPVDAIIHDRITNVDKTDWLMRSGYMRAKGIDMDQFIDSLSAMNHRFSFNPVQGANNESGPSNTIPLLGGRRPNVSANSVADVFEFIGSKSRDAGGPNIFSDSDDERDYVSKVQNENS